VRCAKGGDGGEVSSVGNTCTLRMAHRIAHIDSSHDPVRANARVLRFAAPCVAPRPSAGRVFSIPAASRGQ
jgi:hypothetical protein